MPSPRASTCTPFRPARGRCPRRAAAVLLAAGLLAGPVLLPVPPGGAAWAQTSIVPAASAGDAVGTKRIGPMIIDNAAPLRDVDAEIKPLEYIQSAGLFVGVNDFDRDEITDLRFAVDDAVDMAFLFVEELKLVPPEKAHLFVSGKPVKPETQERLNLLLNKYPGLVHQEARYGDILVALTELAPRTGPKGMVVVSISSHGFEDSETSYILAQDSSLNKALLGSLAIRANVLKESLQTREGQANKVLVFLDACRERVGDGGEGAKAGGVAGPSERFQKEFADAQGMAIIQSAKDGSFAYEDPKIAQNGLFTHYLLQSLRDPKAADADGFIRLGNALKLADHLLQQGTMNKPKPQTISTTRLDMEAVDIPLAYNEAVVRQKEMEQRIAVIRDASSAAENLVISAFHAASEGIEDSARLRMMEKYYEALLQNLQAALEGGAENEFAYEIAQRIAEAENLDALETRLRFLRGRYPQVANIWPSPTPTPTITPTPSPSPSPSPSPTDTPTPTATQTPSPTPSQTPSPTPTDTPSPTPTEAPSPTPTETPSPTPTDAPTPTPSPSPTTVTPTPSPEPTTATPTESPSPTPSPSPTTAKPTDTPSPTASLSPSPSPSRTPQPETPTPSPSPSPSPTDRVTPSPSPPPPPSPSPTPQPERPGQVLRQTSSLIEFSLGGGTTITFVKVDGGTFEMGQRRGENDERNRRDVTLSTYWIAQTEVTQAQYEALMGRNPSFNKGPQFPVEGVTWDEANAFASALSQALGRRASLPTEAQFEYVARGRPGPGDDHDFPFDESQLASHAVFRVPAPRQVGTLQPIAPNLPVYDLLGNVSEWCFDWYNTEYPDDDERDPRGPASGVGRVQRGGHFQALRDPEELLRPCNRAFGSPAVANQRTGFRVVLEN